MIGIVFLDRDTIGPTVSIGRPAFPHRWEEYGRTSPELVFERLRDADVAITNKVPILRDVLGKLPKLKMISVAATGYDVVDVDACAERDIVVSNVRGYAVDTVPEHVFALIFALQRNLVGYRNDVIAGEWQRSGQFWFFTHPIRDLKGKRLGIFGSAVGVIGRALGMDVVFADRKDQSIRRLNRVSWQEVLETSDVKPSYAADTRDQEYDLDKRV